MKKTSCTHICRFPLLQTLLKTALISSCLFTAHIAVAEIAELLDVMEKAENAKPPSNMPGITLRGLTGSNTTGYADMLFPVYGYVNSFIHLDPQILVHDGDEYSLSLGSGFRHLTDSAGIVGAYVFGDYNHSVNGNSFWFISPGIERLGDTVDFSANLYIPASDNPQHVSTSTSQTLGVDHMLFSGHRQFDLLHNTSESVGMGADAELGFRIPMINNPKFYVGGYYFNPEDTSEDNMQGITARLEAPVTNSLMVVLSDSYDSVEGNTIKAGIQFDFGGRRNSRSFKGDLIDRMVDPVHRNLVATAGPSDTAQPIVETTTQTEVVTLDNIAFFDQRNTQYGDGTFENPFQQMNQNNVNAANTGGNNNLYVNSGPYNIGNNNIQLTNNNLFGRQDFEGHAFILAAVGENRPLFQFAPASGTGGFTLNGTENLFDSVRLTGGVAGGAGNGTGIRMVGDSTQSTLFTINNSDVNYFQTGLSASGFGNVHLVVTDSHFDGNGARGLSAQVTNNIVIDALGSTFNGNGTDGLFADAGNSLTIDARSTSFSRNLTGRGLRALAVNDVAIDVEGSSFNNNGGSGLDAQSTAGKVTIAAQDSSFNANAGTGLAVQALNDVFIQAIGVTFNQNAGQGLSAMGANLTIAAQNASFSGNTNGSGLQLQATGNANIQAANVISSGNSLSGMLASGRNVNVSVQSSNFDSNLDRGLEVRSIANGTLTVTAQDSSFSNNQIINGGGGGLFITDANNAIVTLTRSNFDGNRGLGGLVVADVRNSVFVDVVGGSFSGNTGGILTSGLTVAAPNGDTNVIVNIDGATFNNNTGSGLNLTRTSGGANTGIYNATIRNSTVTANGFFGIFGSNSGGVAANMTIDYTGTNFGSGNPPFGNTSQAIAPGTITWNPP